MRGWHLTYGPAWQAGDARFNYRSVDPLTPEVIDVTLQAQRSKGTSRCDRLVVAAQTVGWQPATASLSAGRESAETEVLNCQLQYANSKMEMQIGHCQLQAHIVKTPNFLKINVE